MNLFVEDLPRQYEYDGRVYDFHTDFREWIRFELLMLDEDILPADRWQLIPRLIFPDVPPDPQLGDFIIWFYSCGQRAVKTKSGKGKRNAAVYSFEHDSGYIYAAFLEQYGIDLLDIDYLHWFKFKALFKSLHDCQFTKIMGYRAEDADGKMSAKRKAQLMDLKRIYALPRSLSEQQKIDEARRIMEQYKKSPLSE